MAMGMCAIYTAITPPSEAELLALARDNERKTYGSRRCTVGRKAVAHLLQRVAPAAHQPLVTEILARDLWGFLTPAATRGNHAAMLQRVHQDIAVPTPLWPPGVEMACLVGAPPAHYLGNNLVMLQVELVAKACNAFAMHEAVSDEAVYLNDFLRGTRVRKEAVLLHWDYR